MDDRRRFGRRRQELLSNFGPVVDLSRGGAMVLARKRIAGRVILKLQAHDGTFEIEAEVRHVRRLGFRRFEVGFDFGDLSEEGASTLTEISSFHAFSPRLTG